VIRQLLTAGSAVAGVATGIVDHNLAIAVAVFVAIVPVRAAQGIGDALYIVCRVKLLQRMGVSDPQQSIDPDDGAS
jgi:hypothetical protein